MTENSLSKGGKTQFWRNENSQFIFLFFFFFIRFIMKCIVVLAFCLGISAAWPSKLHADPLDDPSWKAWKSFHGKSYDDIGEERVRNFIWQDNLKRIVSHNDAHKYKLAMNHLGDLVR